MHGFLHVAPGWKRYFWYNKTINIKYGYIMQQTWEKFIKNQKEMFVILAVCYIMFASVVPHQAGNR